MEYENIKLWAMPDHYCGETWVGYYSAGVGQSRDSSPLERSNFRSMLRMLGGESETVQVVRESHWAVGWVEWIANHQDDTKALSIADRVMGELENYPVIDDDDFSREEDEDCAATWESCYSPRERLEYLREHRASMSGEPLQALRAVRGDWHSAASMLACPSDLIY